MIESDRTAGRREPGADHAELPVVPNQAKGSPASRLCEATDRGTARGVAS